MSFLPPIQVLVNGIIMGGIYALIAIGFSLSYNQLRFINLFHGALYLLASYLVYSFFSLAGLGLLLSILLTIPAIVLLNLVVTRYLFLAFPRNEGSGPVLLILSFVLLLLMENIIILLFNSDAKVIRAGLLSGNLSLPGVTLTYQHVLILAIVLISLVAFYLFLHRTRLGLKIRAVSHDTTAAELRGINSTRVIDITAAISALFAALAGVIITLEQNIQPHMGFIMIFKGITATIMGGNKVYGAVIGALIIGILENLSVWYFASGYKNLVTFALLIVFMFFMPKGMFSAQGRGDRAG